jgi:hypothetical protein
MLSEISEEIQGKNPDQNRLDFFHSKFGEVGNCMSHTTSRQSLELFEKYTKRDKK